MKLSAGIFVLQGAEIKSDQSICRLARTSKFKEMDDGYVFALSLSRLSASLRPFVLST